ncbi:MAG: hypothetical protein EBZ98_04785, partial [Actinobacteria bacterium]|nr:hypothetical protein [Actinomycetota bacterium]
NTYTGTTTISNSGGSLKVTGTLGSGASYAGAVTLGSSTVLEFASSSNQTLTGAITDVAGVPSGYGELKQTGASTLSLNPSSASSFKGVTTVSSGGTVKVLAVSSLGGSASGQGTVVSDGATLEVAAAVSSAEPLTIAGAGVSSAGVVNFSSAGTLSGTVALSAASTVQVPTGITGTISGAVSGTSTLTKSGAGTLDLQGVNTHSGDIAISAGTLSVSSSGSLNSGSYSGAISNAGTFTFASSATQTLSGVISGAGVLNKTTGSSTLTVSADNTYTGTTTISAGKISISKDINLGAARRTAVSRSARATARSKCQLRRHSLSLV